MLLEDLDIRLCSPDYQTDWGVVGNPIYATLTRSRSTADILEFQVPGTSLVRSLLMEPQCGVQVRFRGRVEFLGHIYQRGGGIDVEDPVTIYAREETEVFDNTLAVPVPWPVPAGDGELGWYSSGKIEPEALNDSAQAFPRDHESAGHYAWSYPYRNRGWSPWAVGEFLAPLLQANLARVGYTRATVRSGSAPATDLDNNLEGAPYEIVSDYAWSDGVTLTPPPWIVGFDGIMVRNQKLREVVAPFMTWADANTERSFNLFADGGIGEPISVGIRQAPVTFPTVLSKAAGTVLDGRWSQTDHTGSRVILGGPGEMHQRLFVERRDTAREGNGRVVERFRDATSASLRYQGQDEPPAGDGPYAAYPRRYFRESRPTAREKAAVRAQFTAAFGKEFADTAPRYGLTAVLQESDQVFYGGTTGYQLGQKVLLEVGADAPQEGRIEKVTISLTRSDGLTVVPEIGEGLINSKGDLAQAVRRIADGRRRDASDK